MAFPTPTQRTKMTNTRNTGIPTRIAEPTPKAGPKNSIGPKGGSSKSGVPVNRDSNTNKSGKITVRTSKNNTAQIVKKSGSPRPKKTRSNRIIYARLRRMGQ